MKSNLKKIFILLTITMLSIFIFTGCDMSFAFNGGSNELRRADAMEFEVEKSKVEEITRIDINTRVGEIEIIESDDYYVEIDYLFWEDEPVYNIEDGKLFFDDSDTLPNSYSIRFNLDNIIKVYVPEGSVFSQVDLDTSSGDVEIEGFITDKLEVDVAYGDLTVKNIAANKSDFQLSSGSSNIENFDTGELRFKNSYGNSKFKNINTGELLLSDISYESFDVTMSSGNCTIKGLNTGSVNITNSYGNITCEEITAEEVDMDLSSGDLEISKSDIMEIDISNSYGDVTLSLLGKKEDYNLDLETSYGEIEVENQSYEDHLQRDNDGARSINASLSSGDIEITFKE
ncbi:DUF4097 family beta strand repeat protein [Mobilitalea sibirica]|uniref:DUF4097 family beta strand repeat protein n=1 Tax=Mobilitalea sibirica TaxID=1462919 RepID=A0A8J7H5Z5_9FIRM|nr:DUF4097 family beta strand repeat-containing protein [Mobilitalea sibirica]MBH1940441.1 DUF4097 family beta strand repeat protein [Mobilitalea sibirica]